MALASLPEGVETAVQALARARTSLELAAGRIRKELENVPGAAGGGVKEAVEAASGVDS